MGDKMKLTHKRLLFFITLSLVLHGIGFIHYQEHPLFAPEQTGALMAIHITEKSAEQKIKPVPNKKQKSITPTPDSTELQNQTKTSSHNQFDSASVLAEIRQKLAYHFDYPLMARRMGWQGRVLLGFKLDRNGKIHKVHIKQSSGFTVLDNSAKSALIKVNTVKLHSADSLFGSWQLEIPVIYRLEG
jgi:TonB family protein